MSQLTSFGAELEAIVVGASGGIGGALVAQLICDPAIVTVQAWSRRPVAMSDAKLRSVVVDITDEASVAEAARAAGSPRLVIVATGLLHRDQMRPEKSWRELDRERLLESFAVNAIGPALVAKHLLPLLPREHRAVFAALSARVGSISDNKLGGWYGYRASKAALNQLVRTLSIELARTRPQAVAVALHPGTVDTGLSKPFQSNVPGERLQPAELAAAHLLNVIDQVTPADTGALIAWDGKKIPF